MAIQALQIEPHHPQLAALSARCEPSAHSGSTEVPSGSAGVCTPVRITMRREPPPPQPQPLPPAEGPSPPPPPPPSLARSAAPPGAAIRGVYWPLGRSYWPVSSWWAPPLRTTSLLRRLGPIGLLCRRITGPISRLISRLIWPISAWLYRRATAYWPLRPALLRSGAAHDDLSPPPPYPPHPAYPSSPLVKAAALGGGAVVGGLAELPALGTLDADAFGACLQPLALMDLLGARSVSRAWAVTLTPHPSPHPHYHPYPPSLHPTSTRAFTRTLTSTFTLTSHLSPAVLTRYPHPLPPLTQTLGCRAA